jgi:hypothetical protein
LGKERATVPEKSPDASLYRVNPKNEWGNGLGRRSARNSIKTVFFNFTEYLSFFVALFVIQSLFWILCFTTYTNIVNETNTIKSLYDYHIVIDGIDASERAVIENRLYLNSFLDGRNFEEYRFEPPDEFNKYYRLKVTLKDGATPKDFADYYIDNAGVGSGNVLIQTTPLYTYRQDFLHTDIRWAILLGVLLTVLSVVLLMSLYNIRINHFKFLYGIYMTCGAGFKKLFSSAKWEMMVISATTALASLGASWLTVSLMYARVGQRVHMSVRIVLAMILLNFITVYIAVRAPMKRLSGMTPVSLVAAQDNSNLVSSPRRSFRIFNKTFPYHYELYGIWRFRRYFAATLVTAIIFTTLFICGVYIGRMNKTAVMTSGPEADITVDFWDVEFYGPDPSFGIADVVDLMDEVALDCIESVPGVSHSIWLNTIPATGVISHILMRRENLDGGSGYTVNCSNVEGYPYATNSFEYRAFDRHYIDTVCSLYEVEGDPYAVLHDSRKIIISDSIYNTKRFEFRPGDKIYAAQLLYKKEKLDKTYVSEVEALRDQLLYYGFDYLEYEVAAVIHGGEASGRFVVGMNYDEYYRFTGFIEMNKTISVFLDAGTSPREAGDIINQIKGNLIKELGFYSIDFEVGENYAALHSELMNQRQSYTVILLISVLLLLLSPVVWFFSQILFYQKRGKEMNLLRMFGAGERQLERLHIFAGLAISALAMVVTVILSYIASFIVFKLMSEWLPSLGFAGGVRYVFYLSVPALLVSLAVSAACGFLSSYIPYRAGRGRRADGDLGILSGLKER